MSAQYDEWFAIHLKEFIEAIVNQSDTNSIIAQIERGIKYAEASPGDISSVLVKVGRIMVSSSQTTRAQAPVGGEAPAIDLNELSSAVVSRKKGRVKSKLRGSLDDLKDV